MNDSSPSRDRPLIYAGIDEAGYGPMLGPLCVGLTVFAVTGHDPNRGAPDLWKRLNRAVCRRRGDRRGRVAVDDSKKLKGVAGARSHPLHHLELGVLAFLAASGSITDGDESYFDRVIGDVPDAPWYLSRTPLPLAVDGGQMQIAASRLGRALASSGVDFLDLRCEAIDAGEFNRLVDLMGKKSAVNLAAAFRQVDSVWQRWPDAQPRVVVDRQGGRTHYREELQTAFPGAQIRILAESDILSRYVLTRDGSAVTISFLCEAESRHFPVALASMVAKYTRELFMIRLNRYFQNHLPELKPTAGYVTDARRYLTEIDALVKRLDLPRRRLVREV